MPDHHDPTLQAIRAKLEEPQERRNYLGMSAIGHPCERHLWLGLHATGPVKHDAKSELRFSRGHRAEDWMAAMLGEVARVYGHQTPLSAFFGQYRGHPDGFITGLLHLDGVFVWEHKNVKKEKFDKLLRIKETSKPSSVLKKWDNGYHVQGCEYMHYTGIHQHYCTVSHGNVEDFTSIVTPYDEATALSATARAWKILNSVDLPHRNETPLCKWCEWQTECFGGG